jgi:RHS repeat-associated protein
LLTNGVWSYEYDAENRLAAAYSNSLCVVSNAYDHASRRVLKVTPTATYAFVYDGWNLVQETVSTASGVTTNYYVWGKDLSGTMQGAGGVGGLLAVKQGGAWHFPFFDNNGNIKAYVDEQGSVVASYAYDPFGATIAQSGTLADAFAHRFSTKYYDVETGLYYYGYRFYAPELHRWMNRDPIEEKGGMNLYAFCGNDGMNRSDYLGNHITVSKSTVTENGISIEQISISATVQIVLCHKADIQINPGRLKTAIESVWSTTISDWHTLEVKYASGVTGTERRMRKVKLSTSVDMTQTRNRTTEDKTRHRFYFFNQNGRSDALRGGMTSRIYKSNGSYSTTTVAHEFGHWLGLPDLYGDIIVNGKIKSVGRPDNIMGTGTGGVGVGQVFEILKYYNGNRLNRTYDK